MKITLVTINIKNDVITVQCQFGECFEFDMNEYKTLPLWVEKQLEKMHFKRQIGSCMFFE